jgi:ABC-2 type transport system ATP-binding protein
MQSLAIETHQLCRKYGDQTVVDNLNLVVREGSVYGFLGPNGAGKTTTIRMLLGLIKPNTGEVLLSGRALQAPGRVALERVGALVEMPSLYRHLTGRENLEVTRRLLGASKAQIDRVLQIVRLTDAADKRVGHYSLGMKQRLGIALTLLNEPQLLILDEPTNGLDPAGIHEIRDLIHSFPAEYGITVFLSSHLLSEVEQIADTIGIIHQGRLMFQGPLSELHSQRDRKLEIGVSNPQAARDVLVEAGYAVPSISGDCLQLDASAALDPAALNALLVGSGIGVHHLALRQRSLEDIFLSLTGGLPND